MKDLTLYELMGEDHYILAHYKNKMIEVEVLDHDDKQVFFEITHPYAWETLVAFSKQVLMLNKRIEKKME